MNPAQNSRSPVGQVAAVIYAAKSTEDKHGSIPTQLDDCRRLAEGRFDVQAEFSDESASAYSGNRGPQLARAIKLAAAMAAERGAAALLVQHSDRLARGDGNKAMHLVEHALWAQKTQVEIVSVQDPQTFSGSGMTYAALMGDRNHEDSARKSAATRDGLRRRRERGKPIGSIPYGYRVQDPKAKVSDRVPDPAAAKWVTRIFEWTVEGQTPGAIARTLNDHGVRTRRGGTWQARRVRELVPNEAYIGGKGYEAIIDPDLWQRANGAVRRMDPAAVQGRKGGRPAAEDYVLKGVAFCRACGAPLYTRRLAEGRTYSCANVRQARGTCTAHPTINATLVERYVLDHMTSFVDGVEEWIADRLAVRDGEHADLRRRLDAERAALAQLDRDREQHFNAYRGMVKTQDSLARYALEEVERIDGERSAQTSVIQAAEARVAEWTAPGDLDAMLDFYTDLVAVIDGRLRTARGARELNDTLRGMLRGLWVEVTAGELHVEFELRPTDDFDPSGRRGALPRAIPGPSVTDLVADRMALGAQWAAENGPPVSDTSRQAFV